MAEIKQIQVGGQAVIEGVMMRGPEHIATAIRRADQTIELKKEAFYSITQKKKILGLPLVRGFVSLIEMMILGFKTLTFSASRYELDLKEQEKAENKPHKEKSPLVAQLEEIGSYIFAFGLAFVLFGWLPYQLSSLIQLSKENVWFNLFAGSIRIVFFVLYVWLIGRMKDVHRVFQYHGAEHKSVNAYEQGLSLDNQSVQTCTTLHPRCGTSFMFFVLLISILVFSVVDTLVSYLFLKGQNPQIFVRLGYHMLLIPFVSGLSYEVLKMSGKNLKHPLVKIMTVPGMALQRITTQPPSDDMIECAVIAMKAALNMDISEHENVTILD